MNQQEILALLERKRFTKVEFSNDIILAPLFFGSTEYRLTIPAIEDGNWARILLIEDGELIADKLYEKLETGISEIGILAAIDYGRQNDFLAAIMPR